MKFNFYFLWLSAIIIIVFILQQIPGFTEQFVLNQKAIENAEIWRFLTAVFLHGSISHLALNLFALLFFGIILEKSIGSQKFLFIFLISGILANLISVNFYTSSLGASGAIYGLLGALLVVRPTMMVFAFGIIMPMFLAVTVYIIADILRISGLFDPGNIGSIAHLSGAAVGIIFGLALRKPTQKQKKQKIKIPETYMQAWEDRYLRHGYY